MAEERVAIIDIGSNSVRLMRALVSPSGVVAESKRLAMTRLADGLDRTGLISEIRMADTVDAVAAFCREAADNGYAAYGYATSAVRDAANRAAFLERLEQTVGLPVAVLTGEQEGRIAYLGATGGRGALVDIGGGSTQLVTETLSRSWHIGCVRAKDHCARLPIDEMKRILYLWFRGTFDLPPVATPFFTGVGGTITTIGALLLGQTVYDGSKLPQCQITKRKLDMLLHRLSDMGEARRAHPLLRERHDVILQGGILLLYLMEQLHIPVLTPCDRDGMEGYAMYLFQTHRAFSYKTTKDERCTT